MAKRGYRYSHRLTYAYEGGNSGRCVAVDEESARYKAFELGRSVLARGIEGTYTVVAVAPDGAETVVETITTADILAADIVAEAFA